MSLLRQLGRVIGALLRLLRDGIGLLLTLLAGVLVFVLFTEAGAQLALREIGERIGYVHAEDVRGRLWGSLRFGRFRYEDAYVRVELEDVTLDWLPLQLLYASAAVSCLQAATLTVTVKPVEEGDGGAEDDGAITRLPIALDIGELRIDRFGLLLPEAAPLNLDDIELRGSWRGDRVRLAPLAATTPWVERLSVAAEARLLPDAVEITALHLTGLADATLRGRLGYGTDSDLQLDWSALQWPLQGAAQIASDTGSLRWRGTFEDWRYRLDGALAVAGQTLRVNAAGSGTLDGVAADSLQLDSGHGRIDGGGQVIWDETLRVAVGGRIVGLQPQHWLPGLDGLIGGRFDARLTFDSEEPVLAFSIDLDESALRGYPLRLSTAGRYAQERLTLQHCDLTSGASRLQASGGIWPALALDTRFDSSDLASLWPGLNGRAQAQLRVGGTLQAPRIGGEARAQQLAYTDLSVEELRVAGEAGLSAAPQTLHLSGELRARTLRRADLAVEHIVLTGDFDLGGETRVDAELQNLDLGERIDTLRAQLRGRIGEHRLTLDARGASGTLAFAATGGFEASRTTWDGQIDALRVVPAGFAAWLLEAPAALRVQHSGMTLSPTCLASDIGRACAALRPLDDAQRFAFRLERVLLSVLDRWLPGGVRVDGQIDGHGYVDFGEAGLADLRIDLRNSGLQLSRNGLPPLRLLPGQLLVGDDAGRLVLRAELPFEHGGLRLDAQLAPGAALMQRALSGELHAEVPDLAWIQVFNYELEQVRGSLSGALSLGGTPAAPQLAGTLQLRDAGLRLHRAGITLERVNATLSGTSAGSLDVSGEAWSGEGALRITGTFDPWSDPAALDLQLRGDRFLALRTPEAAVWITPDLSIQLARRELHVTGNIDIPRADITPKTVETGVGPSADQVIVRSADDDRAAQRTQVYSDVLLRLGDAVRFDGFGLRTQLRGAVRVQESPGAPTRARGEVNLVGGRYKAYGQDLSLETGRLLFTGGPLTDPGVELRATRKPRVDITVGVFVRGTLDRPEFSLFSTPAMPQERQLSWLVLGRAIDESTGSASDKALVADAALSLGLASGEWLAQRFGGKLLGIDEITLGAQPGESSDQTRLTVGKYLSPRLYISYGVALFQPGYTLRLQYDLSHGFRLTTETGVESGGDLFYTIER